jgi:ABC-type transporter MlaC component
MFKILKLVVLGIFFAGNLQAAVSINSTDARLWANGKGKELLSALAETDLATKYAKLDRMISTDVNVEYVGKFVVGKYAKKMTSVQQKQYTYLFHRYILSLYKQVNLNFDVSKVTYSVDEIIEHPRFTTVLCHIDAKEIIKGAEVKNFPVKFKLIRGSNNQIQAVDVEIANVSMVIEYRKRFYTMIKENNENMDWFLEKLKDRVVANEQNAARKLSATK